MCVTRAKFIAAVYNFLCQTNTYTGILPTTYNSNRALREKMHALQKHRTKPSTTQIVIHCNIYISFLTLTEVHVCEKRIAVKQKHGPLH